MEPFTFSLQVEAIDELQIVCRLRRHGEENYLFYYPADSSVSFTVANQLSSFIATNLHQLEKILRSAIAGKLRVGQLIHCVMIKDFFFLESHHFNSFIRVNRRDDGLKISVHDKGLEPVHKVFADGSCMLATGIAGIGGFILYPDGERQPFYQSFEAVSNNLTELLAVVEGLQRLEGFDRIQVNTDSRFVIRGLAQWVHFWKHNGWQTAYGREVKYREQWQQAYAFSEKKLIEFKWVKGHTGNAEQDFCHQLAKDAVSDSLL